MTHTNPRIASIQNDPPAEPVRINLSDVRVLILVSLVASRTVISGASS
jgi:hypothetical protein